jgi:hypothetical protein
MADMATIKKWSLCRPRRSNWLSRFVNGAVVRRVTYFDPENHRQAEGETFFFPAFYKHHCFQHEHEVRAIMLPNTPPSFGNDEERGGRDVAISVSDLVSAVFVSPYADDWFLDAVKDVARLGGLEVPVRFSPLRGLIARDPEVAMKAGGA